MLKVIESGRTIQIQIPYGRNLGAEAMLGQGEGETFLQLELQEDDSDDDFQINENAASISFHPHPLLLPLYFGVSLF